MCTAAAQARFDPCRHARADVSRAGADRRRRAPAGFPG